MPRILAVQDRSYKLVIDLADRSDAIYNLRSDAVEQHPLDDREAVSVRAYLLEQALDHLRQSRPKMLYAHRIRRVSRTAVENERGTE